MPAIVVKQPVPAGKVSFKKDVDHVETVYHERDDDAMSESSRWSGESEILRRWYGSKKYSTSTRMGRSPILKTRVGNGNEKKSGMAMRAMRMVLTSTCALMRRSSRTVIIENYQPIKSNDH